MIRKGMIMGIALIALALIVVGSALPMKVSAATIQCKQAPPACFGTGNSDTMIGDDNENAMFGSNGDDIMSGKADHDTVAGNSDNDVLSGGKGPDDMSGNLGSDSINGGEGNDFVYHNDFFGNPTGPDGSKDKIDCGSGNDEAWINVSVDHDLAVNCETVHAG